jgi:hypothetical protein
MSVHLEELSDGVAIQLVNEALDEVWENVADEDTEAKAKRKIVLEITLEPDSKREVVMITMAVIKKFAGHKGEEARVMLGVQNGRVVAEEWRSRQTDLEDYVENVVDIKSKKE